MRTSTDSFQEESTEQPQPLKPNPKNIANLAKIEELELKLKQYAICFRIVMNIPLTAS